MARPHSVIMDLVCGTASQRASRFSKEGARPTFLFKLLAEIQELIWYLKFFKFSFYSFDISLAALLITIYWLRCIYLLIGLFIYFCSECLLILLSHFSLTLEFSSKGSSTSAIDPFQWKGTLQRDLPGLALCSHLAFCCDDYCCYGLLSSRGKQMPNINFSYWFIKAQLKS